MSDCLDPRGIATPEDFGRSLSELRSRSGLTIRVVARKLEQRSPGAPSFTTLGGWFSGDHLPTRRLVTFMPGLLAELGVEDPVEVAEWLGALDRARALPGPRPAAAPPPYRGLAPYEPENAAYFCGRAALTASLVDLASRQYEDGGPVIVVGPSGSGKSSLLRAGLIPALASAGLPLAQGPWQHLLFTPGSDPVRELGRQLACVTGIPAELVEQQLRTNPESMATMLGNSAPAEPYTEASPAGTLIVVDQFEELFTADIDEPLRDVFIHALCCAAERPGETAAGAAPALVVIGLRADFYARASSNARLVPALQRAQLVVGPMTESELRQAITEPARKARLGIDDALVELLMRELAPAQRTAPGTAYEAGALPLLSHALLATWQQAKARSLTTELYRAAGGIRGAVAKTAEEAYAALSTAQQDTARRLFMRLVRIDDDASDTRRKVHRAELASYSAQPAGGQLQEVLDKFITARLITVNEQTVEIAHEALISAWPRLGTWLSTDRRWLDMHRRLAGAARDWDAAGREADRLYRGGMLHVIGEQAADPRRAHELNALEREFIEASLAWEAGEQRKARRRVRRRYQVIALLTCLAVVAAGVLGYARELQVTSRREQAQALSRLVASKADRLRDQDVSLSMQLALAAYQISPTPEARSSVLESTDVPAATQLPSLGGPAESIAASRRGGLLATGTSLGAVVLWRTTASHHFEPTGMPLRMAAAPVDALAVSPDGRSLVAAAGQDLYLWDTADSAHPTRLGTLPTAASITSVAISADGRALAAGDSAGAVYLWDISSPGHPALKARLDTGTKAVTGVAFTPDSRVLAAGSEDSRVYLWTIASAAQPTPASTLTGPSSVIFSIAISPDGKYLAAGTGAQHSVYLWDISDPAHPAGAGAPLTGPTDWVNTVAFSPDGRTLAAGSSDGQLWLFSLATRMPVSQLPHPNPVTAVAYYSDQSLATVSSDATNGTARLWEVPGPVITGARDSVFAVSFDAAGSELGVGPGAADNTLTVWNPANIQHPVELGPPLANSPSDSKFSGSGALTPDGRTFVVGCADGSVQLWDISKPQLPVRLGPPIQAATALVESVSISNDGRLLAVSADDGAVHLWNIADRRHPAPLAVLRMPAAGDVFQASFNRRGNLIAAADSNDKVYLWDIASNRRPHLLSTLASFTEPAYSTAFTNGGEVLAASGADDTVRLWGISRPRHPVALATLTGPVANVYSIAYDPRRDVLAAGSTDGTIWLWSLARPRHPAYLATLTGPKVLGVAFSPNGTTLAAGGEDHTVHLWDISTTSVADWICATSGQPITRQEWTEFIPGRPYSPPCR